MRRKRSKRRTKGGEISHLIYDYKYLYSELFGEQDTPLNFVLGKKKKKICVPRGKVRAFVRVLNSLVDYTDTLNLKAGRKLYSLYMYSDQEYDKRNVKFRRTLRHYVILEYVKRKYPNVKLTDNVLAVLSEKMNIPFYLMKNTYKSWVKYKHKLIGNPQKSTYMSDDEVEKHLNDYEKIELEELFGD